MTTIFPFNMYQRILNSERTKQIGGFHVEGDEFILKYSIALRVHSNLEIKPI